jgi:methyl-accepting chemotaxis protein
MLRTAIGRNILTFISLGLLTVAITAAILTYISSNQIYKMSYSEMRIAAESSVHEVKTPIIQAHNLADAIKASIEAGIATKTATRDSIDTLLEYTLKTNPDVIGVSTAWEPNAFDGKDAEFINAPGHDSTGRYLRYLFRDGNTIKSDVLVDYEKPGAGDYYLIPKRTLKNHITVPYSYSVGGKDVLMTTATLPIMINGKFAGNTTADLALTSLQTKLAQIHPFGTGSVTVISNDGAIISHSDPSLLGKNIKDTPLISSGWDALLAQPEKVQEVSSLTGEAELAFAMPAALDGETSWSVVISVPKETVLAGITELLWTSAIVLVVATAALIGLGILLSGRFINRMKKVITATGAVASGNTSVEFADADAKDEIGDLSRSLIVLRDAALQKQRLEQDAEATRNLTEEERQNREKITKQQAMELEFAIQSLGSALDQLSKGDFNCVIQTAFAGELDKLRMNFNGSVESLNRTLSEIGEQTVALDHNAVGIRGAADELSGRTERQAASVEETAAALNEITDTMRVSAGRISEVGNLITKTQSRAQSSELVLNNTMQAMNGIQTSSSEISKISSVIDEIAFQTNLLALNAGVEAARAGEAGKGFAVVAQEVRELAQRSASAAKQIKTLISEAGSQVDTGVRLVTETGEALQAIAVEVNEIEKHISAIVTATSEQTIAIREINDTVNLLDQGTQHNAAMVEEQTAASADLANSVTHLNSLIAQFKLTGKVTQNSAYSRAA